MKKLALCAIIAFAALPLMAAPMKIGVFVPGMQAGSPIYEEMVKGAARFASETPGASYKVFEAGFNQAEWEEKLTSFVAGGGFDIVLTSNPSLPDLIDKISPMFPTQKFICLDGWAEGNPRLHTVLYNQVEQGYVTGYLAGLISTSGLPGANRERKAGMVIGQHYPAMDKLIAPGFEAGLKAVDPSFQLDLRVIGNWFDATKAAELSASMIAAGVDVILPICGSASQGAIKAAKDSGKYLVFFDSDEYNRAPGTILGCTALKQADLAYSRLKAAAAGTLRYGEAEIVGMKEGYIQFLDADPAYLAAVPKEIRDRMSAVTSQIKSGKLSFKVPSLR